MRDNKRRSFMFANRLHRNIMLLVFVSAIVPATVVGLCLYYLIFSITAWEIGFPEAMASILIPALSRVNSIIIIAGPISILLIGMGAFLVSARIVGPFDRIMREIDETIEGKRKGHIYIRHKDAMAGLVSKINRLLDELKRQSYGK